LSNDLRHFQRRPCIADAGRHGLPSAAAGGGTGNASRSSRFGKKNCVPQCRSEIWMIVNVPSRVAMREV